MADADPEALLNPLECREPTLEDLVNLCRHLNAEGARYIVVGGVAVRAAGYSRNTMGLDFVIETGAENEARVFRARMSLPDQAIREIKPGEVEEFGVVRVADEILVDLMKSGCGVDYADAIRDAVFREIDGVRIPFASPMTLWRMKQTVREKDIPDRLFLRKLLEAQGVILEPAPMPAASSPQSLRAWIRRTFGVGD